MKKTVCFILLFSPLLLIAQAPQWIDYSWRTASYPEQDYFMTFISGEVPENSDAKTLLDEYEAQAKAA